MKNCYFFLFTACALAGLPTSAVRAQLTLSGPITFYIGPGGVVAMPSYLTVGSGATLTNEGQLDFGGDLTNNGTVTAPVTPAAALRAMGTAGLQNFTGSASMPVQNLTVNNAAGASISTPLSVTGTVTLSSGLVNIAAGTPLVMQTTATDPLETTTARLVGPVTMATRTVNGTAFGPFLGLSMPAGASVGNLTFTRVTGPTAITTVGSNASAAVYWQVAATGSGSRVMDFSWLAALDNGRNMALATPWRSATPYTTWVPAGAAANAAATNPRQYAPAAPAQAVAGRFTISDPSAPLPVELTAFAARRQGGDARLDWNTASEKNNAYFDVERSRDGLLFEHAGRVAGQGSSTTAHDYQFVDAKVAQYGVSMLYYRLRQVDNNGSAAFSPVRTVAVESAAGLLVSAWPNPSTGAGPHIRIEQATEGLLTATLTDAAGRRLADYRTTARLSEEVLGPETGKLPSGVYLLRVTTASTSQVLKLVRE